MTANNTYTKSHLMSGGKINKDMVMPFLYQCREVFSPVDNSDTIMGEIIKETLGMVSFTAWLDETKHYLMKIFVSEAGCLIKTFPMENGKDLPSLKNISHTEEEMKRYESLAENRARIKRLNTLCEERFEVVCLQFESFFGIKLKEIEGDI